MPPKLGWKADPPKLGTERPDHDAAPLLGTAPPPNRANNLDLIVSILDQGNSDCVVHSGYQNIRGSHVRQGALSPELGSRRMGYFCSRAFHHATGEDDGTYLRTFFASQNKFGFCRESAYPYHVGVNDMPTTAAWRAANDQRDVGGAIAYRRIQSAGRARVDDVKRAIAAGYLVSFGTLVSTAFARNDLGQGPIAPPIGQEIAGGHALLAGAYEDDDFTIVNSWGEEWGGRGLCRFAAAYFEWTETSDLWLVERAPEFSE